MSTNHQVFPGPVRMTRQQPFDAHDTRGLPPYNVLKAAWDLPLPHEDPLRDAERRLLSVAQAVRDWGKR